MINNSNRISWKLKELPNEGFAVDFKSINIENGLVTIETYQGMRTFKYEQIDGHISIWPRAHPGVKPIYA
jgi:hypothetical protein